MTVAKHKMAPPEQSASEAGLVYVCDGRPGIRRIRRGKSFRYVLSDGRPVTDPVTLGRIKRLTIPPAWVDVWICGAQNGHLQATGRDARGRKQYRYHARWRETRDDTKYNRVVQFARLLPRIRRRVAADLRRPGLPREKVLAAVIRVLETSLIRVGNDEYARTNSSYGLTTMRDRHVDVNGSMIRFQFRGKSGKYHQIDLKDRRLAKIVARCQAIPGQELFQYLDSKGSPRDITSSDVNAYLREITDADFTAKDFRTWGGTVLAAMALSKFGTFETKKAAKKNLTRAIEAVAERLGNTPTICRKCYIHPSILSSYLDGMRFTASNGEPAATRAIRNGSLKREEEAVLAFLEKQIAADQRAARGTLIDKLRASITHRRRRSSSSGKR